MRFTNQHRLPGELVTAAYDDQYDRGDSDISVTQLIDAPRIRLLQMERGDEVVKDVSDNFNALLGTAFHALMEENSDPDVLTEERMYAELQGYRISGAMDRIITEGKRLIIQDYKVTSVFTVMAHKPAWDAQLNLYRWLYHKNHGTWPHAEVVALCRDWRPFEAEQKMTQGYPARPIVRIPIKGWTQQEVAGYVGKRMALHRKAEEHWRETGELPECSDNDRWASGKQFALMEKGPNAKSRAIKLFNSRSSAEEYARHSRMFTLHPARKASGKRLVYVDERPGGYKRCNSYCDLRDVCDQWKEFKDNRDFAIMMEKIGADDADAGEV